MAVAVGTASSELKAAVEAPSRWQGHVLGIQTAFQPIRRLDTLAVVGYEALLRIVDRCCRKPIAVPEWIAAYKVEGGTEALGHAERWWWTHHLQRAAGLGAPGGRWLFLNAEPRTLLGQDLAGLGGDGQGWGRRVVVEVTERERETLTRSEWDAVGRAIRAQGWQVALDDWDLLAGDWSAIEGLAPNWIKIPAPALSGVRGDEDAARARVAALATGGIRVVMEGIADADVLQSARALAVPFGQGYFLGRPRPISDGSASPRKGSSGAWGPGKGSHRV
ncbi:MAG: EAL domain-containing protein [Firmicutes bacterium]|nr:EAL domain-containing protein [Alicyclobacillaceae bacterium]MCL6496237.1 EAL domain-containing protein [Bacillota bacterium]